MINDQEKAPGKGQLTTGHHKSDSKKMTDTKTLVNSVMASIPLSGEIPDHHPTGDPSTTLPENASKSNSPKQIELDQRFDKMIADAPEGDSTAIVSSTSGNCAMASEASEASISSTFSEISEISESSKVLKFCSSVSSVSSISSISSIYTWENLALAAQAEEEAKQGLPTQIRKWYEKWIDPVFEANAETWQIQISDMIGKHLMHATGEKNTLALVTAYFDLNTSAFAAISREAFIASAREIMARELASWPEALQSGEAAYYRQLPVPHQEAFRICRSLALRALEKEGQPIFFLSGNQLGKRITISDRDALRMLNAFRFLSCMEKGERWQSGTKPRASLWQWMSPLEAAAKNGAETPACPF